MLVTCLDSTPPSAEGTRNVHTSSSFLTHASSSPPPQPPAAAAGPPRAPLAARSRLPHPHPAVQPPVRWPICGCPCVR